MNERIFVLFFCSFFVNRDKYIFARSSQSKCTHENSLKVYSIIEHPINISLTKGATPLMHQQRHRCRFWVYHTLSSLRIIIIFSASMLAIYYERQEKKIERERIIMQYQVIFHNHDYKITSICINFHSALYTRARDDKHYNYKKVLKLFSHKRIQHLPIRIISQYYKKICFRRKAQNIN